MDAMDSCDAECCCCTCDVDLYDCDCECECCGDACGDLSEWCDLQAGIESLCCCFLACTDKETTTSAESDEKRSVASKKDASAQVPQVVPVKVECIGLTQRHPPTPAQLTPL